jgi:hypothetical protein
MFLSQHELAWLRFRLSRELNRMKRPEISDLLADAAFEVQGRELWIAIPETHDQRLNSVFSTALLNCGLPLDRAVVC